MDRWFFLNYMIYDYFAILNNEHQKKYHKIQQDPEFTVVRGRKNKNNLTFDKEDQNPNVEAFWNFQLTDSAWSK